MEENRIMAIVALEERKFPTGADIVSGLNGRLGEASARLIDTANRTHKTGLS